MAKLIKVIDHITGKTTHEKVDAAEQQAVAPNPKAPPKPKPQKPKKSVEQSVSDSFWNN